MNITLTSQTVPTSPVTPRAAAQVIFDNNYAKLSILPEKHKRAIALLGMIHAISGTTNYETNHRLMREDAKVFLGGISTPLDLWASLASKAWTLGNTADALSTDVNTMLAECKHLLEYSEEELLRCFVFVSLTKT